MIEFMLLMLLLIAIANSALLMALCGTASKLLDSYTKEEPAKIRQSFISDVPVPRPPNYTDIIMTQKPSDELKIIRDN